MEALLQAIKDGTADRWLVVMPKGYAITRLRRQLSDEFGDCFGLRTTTLRSLVLRIGSDMGLAPAIPDIAAEGAIAEISKEKKSTLSKLLSQPSARRAALSTIRELKAAGICHEDLREVRGGGNKFAELADTWREYDEFCEKHGVLDPANIELRVANFGADEISLPGKPEKILLSGFPYVARHLHPLIHTLSKRVRLHVSLPSDKGRTDLFAENEALIERTEEWSIGATDPPVVERVEFARGDGIVGKLQKTLFSTSAEPLSHDPSRIRIASAPRRYDEVEAAAMRILDLIDNHEVNPERIGIAVRKLGHYDQFIRDVFERLGIPYFYRRGAPLLQFPFVRIAMKLTELGQDRFEYSELLGILRSDCLTMDHADLLACAVVEAKIFADEPGNWAPRLETWADKNRRGIVRRDDFQAAVKCLADFLQCCKQVWSSPEKSLSSFRSLLLKHMRTPEEASGKDTHPAWRRLYDSLSEVEEEIGAIDRRFGIKAFDHPIDILRERIRAETVRPANEAVDAVQVLGFFDAGYVELDHLFVLGLDADSVPTPSFRTSLLLSDADISRLRSSELDTRHCLRDGGQRRNLESQTFLLALASAKKEISLSYPQINEDGKETTPSPYLGEIIRIFGLEKAEPETLPGADLRTFEQTPPYRLALRRQMARRLIRTDLPEKDDLVLPVYNLLLQNEDERSFLHRFLRARGIEVGRRIALFSQQAARRDASGIYCGLIEDRDLRKLTAERFGAECLWSATAIEDYATCPFWFFVRHCLGVDEDHLPGEEPSALDEGIMMHKIVKDFFDKSEYPLADLEKSLKRMRDIVDSCLGELAGDTSVPMQLLRSRFHGSMASFVRKEIETTDHIQEEAEYGFGEGDKKCEIEIGGRTIRLQGRIDRIDHYKDDLDPLLVIDYKRSGRKPSFKTCLNGHSLQLPLYILAAKRLLDRKLDSIKAGIYNLRETELSILETTTRSRFGDWAYLFGLEGEQTDKYKAEDPPLRRLDEIVGEILSQIQDAYFPVEGRNGASVERVANLVSRWMPLPPEFGDGGGES